ncbi:hypothetical protein [Nonomuraea sp. NPDC048916]|uniref:hypothetical protein n=1 Tax=Nonomuraea sp. NPDC048916 TaxID=3154232 RepID=UPI0033FE34A6
MALAVAAGYYFGRRRKLRAAAAMAVAGVAGGLKAGKSGLLQKGMQALGSPELTEATDRLRGDLLDAGKAAAVAVTSKQINALSDVIHQRAEGLRHPGAPGGETAPKAPETGAAGATEAGERQEGERKDEAQPQDKQDDQPVSHGERKESPEAESVPSQRGAPVTR